MYPKFTLTQRRTAKNRTPVVHVSPFTKGEKRICRPFSYYLKGGIDLDGVSNRPPLPATFSSAEQISANEIDMGCDPTVGRLDIVDYASARYASEQEKRAAEDLADVK